MKNAALGLRPRAAFLNSVTVFHKACVGCNSMLVEVNMLLICLCT